MTERVSDLDLAWLVAAYGNDKNPATFRREVALALRELMELRGTKRELKWPDDYHLPG